MCIYPDVDLDITNRTKVLGEEKALGRWNTMYHSPKSRRVEDYVYIDTKIKPQYNLTYVYDVASSYDVQWNINLLLLLRRYDLIDIIDMEYEKDEDRYIFKIKIIDDRLTISTNKTEELLAEVREKEKDTFSRNFSILRKHIDKCDKQCLSEMFLDT
jgi:ATP-dependent DNA helicase RecQ